MRTAVEMQGSATEAAVAVAVHVVNTPNSDAREAYEAAFRRIEEQGLFPPVGQRGHIVWLVGDVLHVLDVWDSVDNMKAFMEKLAPILDEFGVQLAGEPEVGEIIHVARQN
jgi:hypothetical protein